jgi:transcriptional regulator with XRE-family HTH domain
MKGRKTDDPLKVLGARLREMRKQAGYGNADIFAYEKGIDRSQWGRYERGEADLQYTTLLKILDALGVTPAEFFKKGFE